MSTILNLIKDVNGANTYCLEFAADGYHMTLSSGIEATLTVPGGVDPTFNKWVAIFQYEQGATVYVNINATAIEPPSSFTATTQDINPDGRFVQPGDVLHFLTNDTTVGIKVSFYAVRK